MDNLPDFKPFMLCGLSWTQARANLNGVDCAIRREHWCSPVVILHEGKLILDDDGELSPFTFAPPMGGIKGDKQARDWMMVPRTDDDGKPIEPTYRATPSSEDHRDG